MTFSDAHNHLQDWGKFDDVLAMLDGFPDGGIQVACVNATSPADWEAVASLADADSRIQPFFGLHPWKLMQAQDDWLDLLRKKLLRYPHAGVGECGVDLWIRGADEIQQKAHFIPQIRFAKELERPLTIHCLKAWKLLLDCFDEEAPPEHGFLLHGFGGSPEMARRMVKLGAYFSFNASFMQERKGRVRDAFKEIPLERLLTETDAPAMTPPSEFWHPAGNTKRDHNHPYNLITTNKALAQIIDTGYDELCASLQGNLRAFLECRAVS